MRIAASIIAAGALALAFGSTAEAGNRTGYSSAHHGHAGVVRVLKVNGFVSWREIERDDGKWEVEDARHRNGGVYDLDIRRGRIVKWERD